MRWESYCCLLPVPRASNSYQRPAVFTDSSAPKHSLKRENKEQNKVGGRRLDPGLRVQVRKQSPPPTWLWWGKAEGWRRRTRTGRGGGTELSWVTWHTHGVSSAPMAEPHCHSPLPSCTTPCFFHMPSASSRCSASHRPLRGHAQALLAGWSPSGPSW